MAQILSNLVKLFIPAVEGNSAAAGELVSALSGSKEQFRAKLTEILRRLGGKPDTIEALTAAVMKSWDDIHEPLSQFVGQAATHMSKNGIKVLFGGAEDQSGRLTQFQKNMKRF